MLIDVLMGLALLRALVDDEEILDEPRLVGVSLTPPTVFLEGEATDP